MDRLFRFAEWLIAGLMLGMVLMVFGNVVLRYGFNSGITVSEEMARYSFVWMTFIGAIVALREGRHLGMGNLVQHLPRRGKVICAALCQAIIVACCLMLVWGTARQHHVNATTMAPVTGMSLIWVYGITYLVGACMALIAAHMFWRIVTGRARDDELIAVEGEDAATEHSAMKS